MFGERQRHREHRALADLRPEADRVLEREPKAPHDGEAEAEALPALLARFASLKLLEDRVAQLLRDAGSRVPHLDDPPAAARPAADQHPAPPRVTQAVGDQVLNDAPQ